MAKRPPPPKRQSVPVKQASPVRQPPPKLMERAPMSPPMRTAPAPIAAPYGADQYANRMESLAQILRSNPAVQLPPTQALPYNPSMRPLRPEIYAEAQEQLERNQSMPFDPYKQSLPFNPSATPDYLAPPTQPMPFNPRTESLPLNPPAQAQPFGPFDPSMQSLPRNPPTDLFGNSVNMQQPVGMGEFQRGNQFTNFGSSQSMSPWGMQAPGSTRPMQQPFGIGGGSMGGFQQPFGGSPQRKNGPFAPDPYVNRMQPYGGGGFSGGAQMSPGLTYQKPQMSPGLTYPPQNQGTRARPGRWGGSMFSNKRGVFG